MKAESAPVSAPPFCPHCERSLAEDSRYCPHCGYRRKGLRAKPLTGFTVLYVLLLVMSLTLLTIAFNLPTAENLLESILISLGTSLGPVALVGLIYEALLKDSLREAALRSYQEFSETAFSKSLMKLDQESASLESLTKRLLHVGGVGLVGVFPERRYALPYIEEAIAAEHKEIFIVGTSFRGLLWPGPGEERVMSLIGEKISGAECDVRFILTHPAFAHLRQSLEVVQRQEKFHIAQEILETVRILQNAGVPHENIRFVRGTPTIFGLMTTKLMLLNPYPLQRQAFTSLTVLLDSKSGENPAYRAFEQSHFRGVWEGNNVDSIAGFDVVSLQRVFDSSLHSMELCASARKINYEDFAPDTANPGMQRTSQARR